MIGFASACIFIATVCLGTPDRNSPATVAASSGAEWSQDATTRATATSGTERRATGQETVLYNFGPLPDAQFPGYAAGLIADASGALYGTTTQGGNSTACTLGTEILGCGTVYKLTPSGSSYAERILYSFQGGSDGADPNGALFADRTGALYGTTYQGGGPKNYGTIFKLTPSGSTYKESVLHSFLNGSDGRYPQGALIAGARGTLYGTTSGGGKFGFGTVFKLTPSQGAYKEQILYSFQGGTNDGASPMAGLVADRSGAYYGTTLNGGTGGCYDGCGVAFKLSPNGNGYKESVIWNLPGAAGEAYPYDGLTLDGSGALYGTASDGSGGLGPVFKLTPSGPGYSVHILYAFRGHQDGQQPMGSVIIDRTGSLYGTTLYGGYTCFSTYGCGTVYKLTPSAGGYKESIVYRFKPGTRSNNFPSEGLLADASLALYGTADGGKNGFGVVFRVTQ